MSCASQKVLIVTHQSVSRHAHSMNLLSSPVYHVHCVIIALKAFIQWIDGINLMYTFCNCGLQYHYTLCTVLQMILVSSVR